MFHVKHQLEQTRDFLSSKSPTPYSLEKLGAYLDLIIKWNLKVDLVSPGPRDLLVERHIQDSYAAFLLIENELGEYSNCMDVGSGAGLPGIVFAILKPQARFFLCEPREKRQIFLRQAVESLGLSNVELLHSRLEDVTGSYDLICSRALGMQKQFLSLSSKLLNQDGSICQLLGPSWQGEADKVIDYRLYEGGPSRKLAFLNAQASS